MFQQYVISRFTLYFVAAVRWGMAKLRKNIDSVARWPRRLSSAVSQQPMGITFHKLRKRKFRRNVWELVLPLSIQL